MSEIELTHIPSRTITTPDTYTTPEGRTFEVTQDLSADDPRTWIEPEHSALWVLDRSRYGGEDAKPEGNELVDAFDRFRETSRDDDTAFETFTRWRAIFRPKDASTVAMQTIRGHSQSDWADVFAVVSEGYGTAQDTIDLFRMWKFGDVWMVNEEGGESLGGLYAENQKDAIAQFLENTDAPEARSKTPDPELRINTGFIYEECDEGGPFTQYLGLDTANFLKQVGGDAVALALQETLESDECTEVLERIVTMTLDRLIEKTGVRCDECEQTATNFWPDLKTPVQLCSSCAINAMRSGWYPGKED